MIKYADTAGHKTYRWGDNHFVMIVATYRKERTSIHSPLPPKKEKVFIHTNSLSVMDFIYNQWGKLPKTLVYDRFSVQLYKYGWSSWKLEYTPIVAKYMDKYAEKVGLDEI